MGIITGLSGSKVELIGKNANSQKPVGFVKI